MDANLMMVALLGLPSAEATREVNFLTHPSLVEAGIAADFRDCLETGDPNFAERRTSASGAKICFCVTI